MKQVALTAFVARSPRDALAVWLKMGWGGRDQRKPQYPAGGGGDKVLFRDAQQQPALHRSTSSEDSEEELWHRPTSTAR